MTKTPGKNSFDDKLTQIQRDYNNQSLQLGDLCYKLDVMELAKKRILSQMAETNALYEATLKEKEKAEKKANIASEGIAPQPIAPAVEPSEQTNTSDQGAPNESV